MPKKSPPTGFAQRLKALREAAGLTQAQLAERAGLYSFSVAKLEQGVQEPTWPTVLALAQALGVNCLAFCPDATLGEPPTDSPKPGPGRPQKQRFPSLDDQTNNEGEEQTPPKKSLKRPGKEQG
jgi:transcriptional regulator with XRE-family HTH domain